MKYKNLHIFFIVLVLSVTQVIAQDIPDRPSPPRLVNDFVGLLTNQQTNHLERKLVAFNDTNSTQIAILIINDLKGYDVADYAQRVAQKWGVGQKKYDNGAIIVLKPKTAASKGEINIDVGYGLEPIIPDITANRIIDNEMIPRFQGNDYFGGLDAATNVMISLAAGQFTADQYKDRAEGGGGLIGFLVPLIVMIIIFSMINRRRGNYYDSTGKKSSSLPLWTALWLGSAIGGSRGGSWGNFSSGSGGFGGGGGGFGGFGGGGFGGGGASGSW